MATIAKGNNPITIIVQFTVEPQYQHSVPDIVSKTIPEILKKQKGFISSSFHLSTDGTRVVNYAQWRSREDYAAFNQNPEASAAVAQIMAVAAAINAKVETHEYEVLFTIE